MKHCVDGTWLRYKLGYWFASEWIGDTGLLAVDLGGLPTHPLPRLPQPGRPGLYAPA